jgi:hypothetical protein
MATRKVAGIEHLKHFNSLGFIAMIDCIFGIGLASSTLNYFVRSILGAHWPIAAWCFFAALFAFHFRDNISVKVVIVVAPPTLGMSAVLAFVDGIEIAS